MSTQQPTQARTPQEPQAQESQTKTTQKPSVPSDDGDKAPSEQELASMSGEQKQRLFQRFSNTFMRRRTHMSQHALEGLSPDYAQYFASAQTTDLRVLFTKPRRKITLEIGFGMGHSLIDMALAAPDTNFIGIEVHEPGLGLTAYNCKKQGLNNLKLINGDAIALLQQLPDDHIDTVQLYFPDPWQKKRHFKRRFVSHERMPLVVAKLKTGGVFHTATDWEDYAVWMLDVLDNTENLTNIAGKGNYHPRPKFRPLTKFEKRGIEAGHGVWDLLYSKNTASQT